MTCANIATVSEQLFVDLCSQKNLACVRIAEGVVPVADFSIKLHELEIFAEVKQLDFNEKDQQIFAAYCAGEVITSMAPTARVREKIANAYRQLKGYSRNGSPCIIVLYNNTGSWNRIDTYTVTTAMFGVFEFCLGLSQIGSALLRGH